MLEQVNTDTTLSFETIDADELAKRLSLPVTWIREQVRSRATDKIPHLRFGKYVRFEWGSPDLRGWVERHRYKPR